MTEAQLILLIVNGAVVFLAASLFVKLLCDEYVRMLELHGLLRPRQVVADGAPRSAPTESPGSTRRGRIGAP